MYSITKKVLCFLLGLALASTTEAFFLKWGSDTSRQAVQQKTWMQPLGPSMSSAYRYQYYPAYEPRKMYQPQPYRQPELPPSMSPFPISVPAGSNLTPVSLQHVQLVPCMCPVAPEEADKLHEQLGPGPYLAQTYSQQTYNVPQQLEVPADNAKNNPKQ